MSDRWDLVGILESTASRHRRWGRLVRLEAAGPEEEVPLPPGLAHGNGKRLRLRATFERGTTDATFTFARRGASWVVRDFEIESPDPSDRPGLDTHLRRIAGEVLERIAGQRWNEVHYRLRRAERVANPIEAWAQRMTAHLDGTGTFVRVEERGWAFAEGRGAYAARLVFENEQRDVDVDLAYDPSEGRAV